MSLRYCTYCGNPLPRGVKFCPNCGHAAPGTPTDNSASPNNSPSPTNQNLKESVTHVTNKLSQAKLPNSEEVSGYFQWLLKIIKHPFANIENPTYFGLITIIPFYILFGLIAKSVIKSDFLKNVANILGPVISQNAHVDISKVTTELVNSNGYGKVMNGMASSWNLALYGLLPITLIILYGSLMAFRPNTGLTLMPLNNFVQRFSWSLPLLVLAYLLKLINQANLSVYLLIAIGIIHLVALLATLKIYQYEYRFNYLIVMIIAAVIFIGGLGFAAKDAKYISKSMLQKEASYIQNNTDSDNDASDFDWNNVLNPSSNNSDDAND